MHTSSRKLGWGLVLVGLAAAGAGVAVFGTRAVTEPLHSGAYTTWWLLSLAAGLALVEIGCGWNARFFVALEKESYRGAFEGTGLAALALGVVVFGNSVVLFSLRDSTGPVGWMATGAVLCLAGLAAQHRHMVRLCKSPEFPLVVMVSGIAVLGAVALGLVSVLSLRHHTRVHLVSGGLGELDKRSKSIIEGLESPIRIISTLATDPNPANDRAEFLNIVRDRSNLLLDEYASHSPQIQFIPLDPHADPDARERFEEELDMDLHADTVTFDGSAGRRVVPLGALIVTSPAGNEPETFRGEEVFSSTLQALAEGSATVVGFVTGHGERLTEDFGERTGLSIIVELLEGDNCTVRDIVLPEVPEDCNMLVVAGPRRPFLPQELAALQRWLRDGRGGLILLLDPVGPAGQASGLEPLLQSQGIRAATDLTIVQMTRGFRGAVPRAQVVTTQHGPGGAQQHPVTEEMRGLRTAYDKACPVLSVERGRKGDPVIELVRTSADAWAKAGLDPTDPTRLRPDPARDKRGPFPLAVAREGENGGRMVVVGDSDFVTNRFLRQGALGNATLFRNAVAWAAGKEYKVGIAATRFGKVDGIDNLTRSKRALTWWATVFAPPFHIVLIGLIVWWARRR